MSKFDSLNRFTYNSSTLDISRSKFKRPFSHKTTMMSGVLTPLYCDEVLPGDSVKIDLSSVVRQLTPVVPVMDDSFIDFYAFYVPMRLCTRGPNDWQELCGENTQGIWAEETEVTLKTTGNYLTPNELTLKGIVPSSVANYLGLPIVDHATLEACGLDISSLKFVGLTKIWNEWFRDQNTQAPIEIETLWDSAPSGIGDSLFDAKASDSNYPFKVNKFHDYFTSALPAPQKGSAVYLPLLDGEVPVITGAYNSNLPINSRPIQFGKVGSPSPSLALNTSGSAIGGDAKLGNAQVSDSTYYPNNLYADLAQASGASVNQIRLSFAIQRMFEKDARGGTRYREMLLSHFGVSNGDLLLQVPEYLGGVSVPLNITQVLNTADSTTTPLGSTGAFGNTASSNLIVPGKSFTEFGYVYVVACIRTAQSYSQGVHRSWLKFRRFDFYYPVFANLGEQAIKNIELYLSVSESKNNEGFGYQEAWAEYRYNPNLVTGYFAPSAKDVKLTAWTYTNNFSDTPVLNPSFLTQPQSQIGDTLVSNDTPYQFLCDFYFNCDYTRPMPLFSIPGLLDHH